jgi:hypothetical protein
VAWDDTKITVIFARRVCSQADLDDLASALRTIYPADQGLVLTTSPYVARQVQLPNGFEFLYLGDVTILTDDLMANNDLGIRLERLTLNMLGRTKKVAIEKDKTANLGADGEKTGPAGAASIRTNASTPAQGTVAQETELRKWLVSKMTAAPMEPQPKATMQRAAREAELKFSARAFERSWRAAVLESEAIAWSVPGRRRPRRIDTRT